MPPVALIPVPFSSLTRLIATASRFCGRESSMLKVRQARRHVHAGDVIRLALLAPELRFPIDVEAEVVGRTLSPETLMVRYTLADLSQMECALGLLYSASEPRLPVALDVSTFHHRRCRLSELSSRGATFEVANDGSLELCAPDADAWLRLPHENGRLDLPGHIAWVQPRPNRVRSRLHVTFAATTAATRRCLDDIVFRFRLGATPWTPKLLAPGL